MRERGIRGSAETTKLPRARQSTNTATTMANVNCEEPRANAPMRLSVV
jgi:hypothetical protein